MYKLKIALPILFTILVLTASYSVAEISSGRALDSEKSFSVIVKPGLITSLSGNVEETKRAYTDTPGAGTDYEHYLQNYDLEELGFDESYGSFGLSLEKQSRFLTFLMDFSYLEADAHAVAKDEPFAIGVEEVEYNGQTYEYMLIPQGESVDVDIQAGTLELGLFLTPCNFTVPNRISISPWLRVGLLAMAGNYTIDGGPPQGVTTYEYHPYDYVIGGEGTGWAGLVLPEYGLGGEVKLALGPNGTELVIQGNILLLDWAGASGDLGVDARNEKDIDLSYISYDAQAMLEIPISDDADFLLGMSFRHLEVDATIDAQHRTEEEQDELREKYDKAAEFAMNTFYVLIGIRY